MGAAWEITKKNRGASKVRRAFKTYSLVALGALMLSMAVGCGKEPGLEGGEASARKYSLSELEPAVVEAGNRFGLELYLHMTKAAPDDNVVMSPYSVASAIGIVQLGAQGSTRDEMSEVLQTAQMTPEAWSRGQQVLRDLLEHSGREVRLSTANSLWIRKGAGIKQAFVEQARSVFAADAKELDFTRDRKAVQAINDWVSQKTEGKIDHIIEGPISSQKVLYVINALYFKGQWQHPFQEGQTKPGDFHIKPGQPVQVQMMKQQNQFRYAEDPLYQAVRLPYGDGKLAMTLVLPAAHTDVDAVAEKLAGDAGFWNREMEAQRVILELPRFKLEGKYKLNEPLQSMGLKEAFDGNKAKFGGISDQASLQIDEVLHKTYIHVNEQGTEAAAVTSIGMAGSAPPSAEPVNMTVNRPFVVAIQSMETGSILFLGTVRNPVE
ncbi:serpin family protein [Paenibacillus puerhi]|uniref:serpin family protein n=1 Tax=Paenibacillus puerhi TaxID=2692622 RepID=UPI00135BCEE8|nr:serpin family protein [Paenibacillus puerhi]